MDNNNQLNKQPISPNILQSIASRNLAEEGYETLVQMGIEASEIKTYSQWVLGKLGDTVSVKYGNLKRYANEINQKYEVIQQYVNTYRKFSKEDPSFSPEKYSGSISWGMLQLVATKSDSPQELIDKLLDEGIRTVEGAYKRIKEKETGVKIPHKPKIGLHWDYGIQKYKIQFRLEELDLIDWRDVKQQLINYLEALK